MPTQIQLNRTAKKFISDFDLPGPSQKGDHYLHMPTWKTNI